MRTRPFPPAGVFYIYGAASNDLSTANLVNASKTLVKADAAGIGACGIAFDNAGNLYMTRKNSVANLNPATGNVIGVPAVVTGATNDLDNLLAVRGDGVMFAGARNVKLPPTRLFAIDPATGNTTSISSIPLALSGMTFDVAPTPRFGVSGPKVRRSSKSTSILKGTYTSSVPATISFRNASVVTNSGSWKLRLSKLRRGTNLVKVLCNDAAGQRRSTTLRIIVAG